MSKTVRHIILPLIASVIWGTAFIFQSTSADIIPPLAFNSARCFIGAFALAIIIPLFRKLTHVTDIPEKTPQGKKDLLLGGVCCGAAVSTAAYFQQAAMTETTAGKAGFITTLYVILVPIWAIFMKKKVTAKVWISTFLAMTGLYFLCVTEAFTVVPADGLLLLSALFFSFHIMIIDHFTQKVDGMMLSMMQFFVAGIVSLILSLIFEKTSVSAMLSCTGSLLYMGIMSSGIAYTLQIIAQKGSNPAIVTLLLSLESAFAAISGAIFLKEQMSAREYLGCFLMLAAVLLSQANFKKKKRS